jgi:hypothetical protein
VRVKINAESSAWLAPVCFQDLDVNPPKSHPSSDWITVRVPGKSHLAWKFAAEKPSLTSVRTIFYFIVNWNQNNYTLEK